MMRLPGIKLAALTLCAAAAPGTTPPRGGPDPSVRDTAALRRSLADALGGDFRIVRHELSSGLRERGGTFWLVHARPVRSGDYHLTYRYAWRDHTHPENPLYTHVEHASVVRVGERGCQRRREAKDACLGDTIILPFVLNDFGGHTFTVTRRDPGAPLALTDGDGEMTPEPVPNPAAPHLEYLGSHSDEMPHRNGGSTTVYSASFRAGAPGRLNLLVSAGPRGDAMPGIGSGSIPVVVVPRGRPVTVLLRQEDVVGRDEARGFSSHGGNQYLTALELLQPGDVITVEYLRVVTPARWERTGGGPEVRAPKHVPPAIQRLPFRLDTAAQFNAWIARHPPAGGAW